MLKNKSWIVSFSVYVAEAIKKIFKLYAEADPKPKSIVLVGHSMVRLSLLQCLSAGSETFYRNTLVAV